MKSISVPLNLLIFLVVLTGCTRTRTSPRLVKEFAPQIDLMRTSIKNTANISEVEKAAKNNELDAKLAELQKVQDAFDKEMQTFEADLKTLTKNANLWGYEGVIIKRAGLLSGIGAAALTAASPANAVWIAGLSGFAGAANGYASASGAEGFSKSAVAAYLKPIVKQVNEVALEFSLAEARLYLWNPDDKTKFIEAMGKQQRVVGRLQAARIQLLQPVTSVEPDENVRSLVETQKALIEELKKKIPPR
jgi:hypothetical protein